MNANNLVAIVREVADAHFKEDNLSERARAALAGGDSFTMVIHCPEVPTGMCYDEVLDFVREKGDVTALSGYDHNGRLIHFNRDGRRSL